MTYLYIDGKLKDFNFQWLLLRTNRTSMV